MKFAAIIPARGGSKRLPGKNLALVGGVPLVVRAIESALSCDEVWVSTDCADIAAVATAAGARVLMRPAHLATDLATTESVLVHWWRSLRSRPDALVLLQPTSPLRTSAHVDGAIALLHATGADSVCSVVRNSHAAFAGRAYPREGWTQFRPFRPIDYRPRTQDVRVVLEENGAVYVTRAAAWAETGNRMGGTVAAYVMDAVDSIDIDTESDLRLANAALISQRERGEAA